LGYIWELERGKGYMDIQTLSGYFHQYGILVIFIIVFLEYLNMPGFPAGIIMPLTGVWASKGSIGFIPAFLLSVLAGLCGSWALYFLGRCGGEIILNKYTKKFPKHQPVINRAFDYIGKKGYLAVFLGKLIPMIRTIISIPAGILRLNFLYYTIYSALGIAIWNLVFIGAGYIFGEAVFQMLS